jgi:membrane protease YdiL (CAAX protease family)
MFLNQVFKGLNDWYRYIFGTIIVFMAYFLGQLPLTGVLYARLSADNELGMDDLSNFESSMNFENMGIDKNVGFLLLILMFAFALSGLYLAVRYLHHKDFKDLITPNRQINIQKILFGFCFWLLLTILMEAINYMVAPDNYVFRWSGGSFFVLLFISLVFLPIQTSFEELFFRGYLMQGMAFFARNKWIPILASSIIFGLVHGTNPEVAKYGFWTMQVYYILAGLFLAMITVLDDGLELALGVHAATNIAGATLFTYQGSVLQTDSLFISQEIKPWVMIFGFILASVIFIWYCGRKYHWPPISSLLGEVLPISDATVTNIDFEKQI